ncbi:MAG: response regulator [Tateyamaria sp.]|jgi:two-component system C4-dicarboxylate transport response regulator DctD|uniref:response regulator n=1 Tax=unclassified Tateyamaria TaxID=2645127 RepID=UPI000D5586C1|nr:response regulator [Tateyamaria sp. Alg231-49]
MLKKVLIIEDDPVLRASIEQALELADLEPIPTNGFTQARRSIRSNFRGVILSDIKMPDHNGFDVLNFTQARDPNLPVVLLTGHSDVSTAMRAVRFGAYEYLEKPCDPQRLADVMRRALEHRTLVLENRAMLEEFDEDHFVAEGGSLTERLEAHEKKIIEQALVSTNGKVAKAAEQLGIPRNTLYDRMTKLRVVPKAFKR